jgi:hypothetical protein
MTFSMMVAQVPCFADEFVDWFDGIAANNIRVFNPRHPRFRY